MTSLRKKLALLAILSLTSCSSIWGPKLDNLERSSAVNRIMNSWVGHYESELVASWGPPTKILSDEKSGNILIYESLKGTWGDEKDKRIEGGATYTTSPGQSGYAATRMFYVNEEGVIYSWKWSGL